MCARSASISGSDGRRFEAVLVQPAANRSIDAMNSAAAATRARMAVLLSVGWCPGLESNQHDPPRGRPLRAAAPRCAVVLRWMVPGTGVEPARPCGHQDLNLARLPFPPPGRSVTNASVH